jgi:hypothetical protein
MAAVRKMPGAAGRVVLVMSGGTTPEERFSLAVSREAIDIRSEMSA